MRKLFLFIFLTILATNLLAYEELQKNEEYLEYMNIYENYGDNGYGNIPVPVSINNDIIGSKAVLPDTYDLRDYGYMMPVRTQSPYQSCWAFSTCASLESYAMRKYDFSSISLSPLNMSNRNPIDWVSLNSGGNFITSMAYLGNLHGPVLEENNPYVSPYTSSKEQYDICGICEEVNIVEDGKSGLSEDEISAIKELIYTKGALQLNYKHNSSYLNSQNAAYYSPNKLTSGGHAVTIVGWDDNYSRDNFKHTPDGDGAFLFKNSWGVSSGDKGYYWISYYDVNINTCALFTYSDIEDVTYNKIYSYNNSSVSSSASPKYGAIKIKMEEDGYIEGVQLYSLNNGVKYSFDIYVNDSLKASKSYTFKYYGYKNVLLDSDIKVKKDDIVWVKFDFNKNNDSTIKYPLPIENQWNSYIPANYEEPYCSYYSSDGVDFQKINDNSNLACGLLVKTEGVVYPTSITLNKSKIELDKGETYQLEYVILPNDCSNKSVKWSSSDKTVATVDSKGKVTAIGEGEAVITCKSTIKSSVYSKCTVTVKDEINITGVKLNKTSLNLYVYETENLTAVLSPENATNKNLTWTSSNKKVATVSSTGVVYGVSSGSATITCKTEDGGYTAKCKVTVKDYIHVTSLKLNKTSLNIVVNKSEQLTVTVLPNDATCKDVIWASSNEKIATVSNSGKVKGIKAGTAYIIVTSSDGKKTDKCKVVVKANVKVTGVKLNKTTMNLGLYKSEQLTATVLPENATNKNIKWTSSDTSIASVSSSGVVKGNKEGKATITVVTLDGSKKATCKVTVKKISVKSISLNKKSTSIYVGKTTQLIATVSPENATDKTVYWKSSKTSIATVSNKGVVKGIKKGTCYITAYTKDGNIKAKCNITVK